jgi:hypothetical protein
MKPIENHKLLIDADCPMCRLYGNSFESNGIIAKGSCSPYQTTHTEITKLIDMERAKNEIAFINTKTGQTIYGFDAIRYIIMHRFPKLSSLLQSTFIDTFGRKLYKFVSMNRKVIAPSKINPANDRDCRPSVNLKYRWLFIVLVAIFSSIVINSYSVKMLALIGQKTDLPRELLMCLGQIAWQFIFLNVLLKGKMIDYIGNMITVSLIGTILLIPMLVIGKLFDLNGYIYLGYFMMVVGIMLLEHMRRCKILGIGLWPSISWVMYRTAFLGILILLK